jgi:hypothetical protein
MKQPFTIELPILRSQKLLLFGLIFFIFSIAGILSTVLICRLFHFSVVLIVASVLLFFVLPLIFADKKIKQLTRKGVVKLSENSIAIDVYDRKTLLLKEQSLYPYSGIKAYQLIESEYKDFSSIKLILKNGRKVKYLFFKQLNDESNIIKNVWEFFQDYNKERSENERITLLPNFYNTKAGNYTIIGLGVLIVISIALQVVYKPQTIPFSLITGIALYLKIKAQQKSGKELYERFK